jgi:hypothetical protein
VTKGQWSVTRIEGIDARAQTIYFSSTEATPLERQLYAVRFDGSGKRRLTQPAGNHSIDMSPDTRYYIDRWSSVRQPQQVELWATGGRMLKKMEDNAAASRWLETHTYSPAEIFSFTTSDGVKDRRQHGEAVQLRFHQAVPGGLRRVRRAGLAAGLQFVQQQRFLPVAGAGGVLSSSGSTTGAATITAAPS